MKLWQPFSWLGGIWRAVVGGTSQVSQPRLSADSDAGECVTADAMLQISAAWACCRLLSQTVSTLPLKLYQKQDGKRTEVVGDDLSVIIGRRPNAFMSALKFWEMMLMGICLWGNAYALKRVVGGRLVALIPMRPECMAIALYDDRIEYLYTERGVQKTYSQAEIFHLKGLSVDGIVGLSPISYARQSVGLAKAADKAAASTFKNGLRAGGVLKYSNWLKPEQREEARANVVEKFSGAMNTGKTMILEGGMEYATVTMNPADAELLSSRKYQLEEIARWYGVPPWMIGYTEKATSWGTGLEQQNIGFLTYTLSAYISEVESAIYNQLLTPAQRAKGQYAEYSLEGLLRADSAGRAQFYSTMTQNGLMTRNEGRAKENMDPQPGGDVLTVQSNLVPLDQLGTQTPAQALKQALQHLLAEDQP